jgi:hypothetical protein
MKNLFLLLFVVVLSPAHAIFAQSPVVFTDVHFAGKSQSLKAGDYRTANLTIGDDVISSIRVPDGFKVVVFEHDNFEGDFFEIPTSVPSLDFWSDRISSIRVIDLQNRTTTNTNTTTNPTPTTNTNTPTGNTQNTSGSTQPWWDTQKPSINYSPTDIVIFADRNFQGQGQILAEGRYNDTQLSIGNDNMSSIKIPQGFTVRLFENGGYDGSFVDLKSEVSDLNTINWDNRVSSIQVFKGNPPTNTSTGNAAILYQHSNYGGRNISLGEGKYTAKDFPLAQDLTAISLSRGFYIRLFEQDNFQGNSIDISTNIRDLGEMGWNDKAMSLEIIRGTAPNQQFNNNNNTWGNANNNNWVNANEVIIYQYTNYSGKMMNLQEGNYGTLRNMNVGNYDISSIRIPMGFTVRLYARENGQGSFVDITQDMDNLSRIGWDNRAMSVQVVRTGNNSNGNWNNGNNNNWNNGNNLPNDNSNNNNFPNNSVFYGNLNRSYRMAQNGIDYRVRIANNGSTSQIQTQSGTGAWTSVRVVSADNQRGYYRIRDNSNNEFDINLQNNGSSLILSNRNSSWTYFAE